MSELAELFFSHLEFVSWRARPIASNDWKAQMKIWQLVTCEKRYRRDMPRGDWIMEELNEIDMTRVY